MSDEKEYARVSEGVPYGDTLEDPHIAHYKYLQASNYRDRGGVCRGRVYEHLPKCIHEDIEQGKLNSLYIWCKVHGHALPKHLVVFGERGLVHVIEWNIGD